MELGFKTKTDKNGNTYYLTFDTETKVLGYPYRVCCVDYIAVGKRDLLKLRQKLKEEGYYEA